MQKLPTQKDKNQEDKDHELMHAYKACINFSQSLELALCVDKSFTNSFIEALLGLLSS